LIHGETYRVGPTPLPNVPVDITGTTKTIGITAGGLPIYKYVDSFTTTTYGEWFIDPIEWDAYDIAVTGAFDLAEMCPYSLSLSPGQDLPVTLTIVSEAGDTLRVLVIDNAGVVIPGAVVSVSGIGSAESSTCGQAFFDTGASTYTVSITKAGFSTYQVGVPVSGDTVHTAVLTP
jgi:hypothetical protein